MFEEDRETFSEGTDLSYGSSDKTCGVAVVSLVSSEIEKDSVNK